MNRHHRPRSRRRQREHRLGNRRANRIRINLDDSELATLEAAAHAHEVGVARWVAETALSVAAGELTPLPAGQRGLLAELINSQVQVRRLTAALRELNPPPLGVDPAGDPVHSHPRQARSRSDRADTPPACPVIPRIHKGGHRTYGLVWYLYGPGKQEEHLDPHLVAAWDTAMARDPRRDPDATIKALAAVLDLPVAALGERAPGKHVWHASIRTAPGDPDLADHAWADIAHRMVTAAGFDTTDDAGCRWIAIRHATDHIHLVVTRARQDGRIPNHHNDAFRMRKAAIDLEHRYELQSTAPADHTAAPAPSRGELGKAGRFGWAQPARIELEQIVRRAAASSANDEEFFARLRAAGLDVLTRIDEHGTLIGYSVAKPGDHNPDGRPVAYAGGRLAPDLSLPRIRARWAGISPPALLEATTPAQRAAARAQALADARRSLGQAHLVLTTAGQPQRAEAVAALADLLTVAAEIAPTVVRQEVSQAAHAFQRAGRTLGITPGTAGLANLRRAVWAMHRAGRALSTQEELAAILALLVAVTAATHAAEHWHHAQSRIAQASAARAAAGHLEQAVGHLRALAKAAEPTRRRTRRPALQRQHRAARDNRRQAGQSDWQQVLAAALPHHEPGVITGDPAWPTLRRTLIRVQESGEDPARALRSVATGYELGTAASLTKVLDYRLKHRRTTSRTTTGQLELGLSLPSPAVQERPR